MINEYLKKVQKNFLLETFDIVKAENSILKGHIIAMNDLIGQLHVSSDRDLRRLGMLRHHLKEIDRLVKKMEKIPADDNTEV